ncbi:MAG TPA: hypothetical protein PKD78_05330, partial [Saprospiraceae bacterium]|nr:hypothetical protein [Saprospiraceae bacterium]
RRHKRARRSGCRCTAPPLEQTCTAAYADLSGLPDGLYWVLLLDEGLRELGRGKVLLMRE